jgi:hypothetical protein
VWEVSITIICPLLFCEEVSLNFIELDEKSFI